MNWRGITLDVFIITYFVLSDAENLTNTERNMIDDKFTCADGKTIVLQDKLCNGVDDCQDVFKSDECNCPDIKNSTRSLCEKWSLFQSIFSQKNSNNSEMSEEMHDIFECILRNELVNCSDNSGTLKCDTPGFCVTKSSFCDGRSCCPDAVDEQHSGFGLKCQIQGVAHSDKCLLPAIYLDDGEPQCINDDKNCFVLDSNGVKTDQIRPHCFQCMDRKNAILFDQVCDGILDCSDFSDECLCHPVLTPEICKVMYEEVRIDNECKNRTGDVSCGNGICIPKSLVCNKKNDCSNKVDEKYCYTKKYRRSLDDSMREKRKIYCNVTNVDENKLESKEAIVCDGNPECDDFEDECVEECLEGNHTLPAYCGINITCIPGSFVCNGVMETQKLLQCNFTYVAAEEENCPQRFYCNSANGRMLSIDKTLVCDGILNCDDGSDEAKERNCALSGRFYCETNDAWIHNSMMLPGNYSPFIPLYKVRDGKFDCKDASDECPISSYESHASHSKSEMIAWTSLRVLIWINGTVALFGNLVVAINLILKMRNIRSMLSKLSVAAVCNHILIFHLSIADLLMGIYLVAIAIQSARFSGRYCLEDRNWRRGNACKALGVLVMISSDMSVYIMVVMAVLRFYTVKNPFSCKFSERALTTVKTSLLCGWIFFIIFALLPLIHPIKQSFITHAWIGHPFFTNFTVNIDDLIILAQKIKTASTRGYVTIDSSISPNSFEGAKTIIAEAFPQIGDITPIGYYGKISLCVPGAFRTSVSKRWVYSVVHFSYKLLGSFALLVLYYRIVRETRTSRKTLKENCHCRPNEQRLMRRITRIVVTNFACLVPVCIASFFYIAGFNIESAAFGIVAVVLLPINSALNPIIYSGLWETIANLFHSARKKSKSINFNATRLSELTNRNNAASSTSISPTHSPINSASN